MPKTVHVTLSGDSPSLERFLVALHEDGNAVCEGNGPLEPAFALSFEWVEGDAALLAKVGYE